MRSQHRVAGQLYLYKSGSIESCVCAPCATIGLCLADVFDLVKSKIYILGLPQLLIVHLLIRQKTKNKLYNYYCNAARQHVVEYEAFPAPTPVLPATPTRGVLPASTHTPPQPQPQPRCLPKNRSRILIHFKPNDPSTTEKTCAHRAL